MTDHPRCAQTRVYRGEHESKEPCQNPTTIEEAGKSWCHVHAPSAVEKRYAANSKRRAERWKVCRKPEHIAFDDLLAALKGFVPEEARTQDCDCGCEGSLDGMCDYEEALEAIAKATSPQAQ